jgi:ATP-dependent DNA ligase
VRAFGEIACIDDAGRPVFRDLLFRRRQCVFIAFDLIDLNGKNLRTLLLIERKAMFTLIASRFLYILNNLRCIFDSAIPLLMCQSLDKTLAAFFGP